MPEVNFQNIITNAINQYNIGNCEESIVQLQSLLKTDPYNFSANRCLAKVYFDTSRKELAYKHLALSDGQLFRGQIKEKYKTIDVFLEHSAFAWECLDIKEINIDGFNN